MQPSRLRTTGLKSERGWGEIYETDYWRESYKSHPFPGGRRECYVFHLKPIKRDFKEHMKTLRCPSWSLEDPSMRHRIPMLGSKVMAVNYSGRKAKVDCVVSGNQFSLKVGRWMLWVSYGPV